MAAFTGGLLLVTHDRHVLDRVTTKVLEIDRGAGYVHVPQSRTAGSGYATYLAARIDARPRLRRGADAPEPRQARAGVVAAWRAGPARPNPRPGSTRPRHSSRAGRRPRRARATSASHSGASGWDLGDRARSGPVLVARCRPSSGRRSAEVLHEVTHPFEPGDRVGVVGANGVGKSTLLDLIAGRLQPTPAPSRSARP